MGAQASIKLIVEASVDVPVDIGSVLHSFLFGPNYALGNGTGADQINQIWTDNRTLAASANEDLDLSGTALQSAVGVNIAFTKVRGILVRAAAANVNNVVVGGAASNGFITPFGAAAHTVNVRPGGCLALIANDAAGYAVTAATADLLRIANSGGGSSVNYDILILGCA